MHFGYLIFIAIATLEVSNPLKFSNSQKMESAFGQLTSRFLTEFQKASGPSLGAVQLWCTSYCRWYFHGEHDFSATSMDDLFRKIVNLECCNFLNLGLLEHLADTAKNSCLTTSLKNYNKTFNDTKIVELMPKTVYYEVIKHKYHQQNYDVAFVKLIEEGLTYGDLKKFTVYLCTGILSVQVNSMIIKSYELGCISIIWLIPSCLTKGAYYSASNNTEVFVQHGIQHIIIGEHMVKPSGAKKEHIMDNLSRAKKEHMANLSGAKEGGIALTLVVSYVCIVYCIIMIESYRDKESYHDMI